eukprot:TRINITY_DN9655_c0_g1_i1.p1 TRINITY_DN9655_c0_g1~~TRINITY_DN9655_c0_g1_i1.p1  ORF type:complete len:312 (+),score=58.75 TRINITY_DN9655_c0_g1_i1:74-937(+)
MKNVLTFKWPKTTPFDEVTRTLDGFSYAVHVPLDQKGKEKMNGVIAFSDAESAYKIYNDPTAKGTLHLSMQQETIAPLFSLSQDELHKVPQKHFNGTIKVVDRYNDVTPALQDLLQRRPLSDFHESDPLIIGLDCEWKPGMQNPVALLQLASNEHAILLRLLEIRKEARDFPPSLRDFLAHPGIRKVGQQVDGDVFKLRKDHSLVTINYEPLSAFPIWHRCKPRKLNYLSAYFLGTCGDKSSQLTNWELPLTRKQIEYAASDAWYSKLVYDKMRSIKYDPVKGVIVP